MTCKDCVFAEWQMTKHAKPRPNLVAHGECTFDITDIVASLPKSLNMRTFKHSIQANRAHECQQHKRKDQ